MENTLAPIWDIPVEFKCPIIGACLTADEHRKVLKRTRHRTKGLKSHQMHSIIMGHLGSENKVSQKVDRYLKYKYRREITMYAGLDSEKFMDTWEQCFRAGKPEGIFFVGATRRDLANDDLAGIFGNIHMLSHANLHHVMAARREIGRQKEANATLARRLKRQKKQILKLNNEKADLKTSLHGLQIQRKKAPRRDGGKMDRSNGVHVLETETRQYKTEIKRLKAENSEHQARNQRLIKAKDRLESESFALQATNEQLSEEINRLVSQVAYCGNSRNLLCGEQISKDCDGRCPTGRVCVRKVLLVGGMTKMKHFYRGLIESNGCEFDYHDGYISKGPRNLEARVKRAELILCPVDCNSHGACHKVKGLCKKHDKMLKILPSSSLSCISNALAENSPSLN